MRRGPYWFQGSADAIYQNLNLLYDERPEYVAVFGADHIYRMDPRQMIAQHVAGDAGVTVAAIRVPIEQASEFGVIETAPDGQTIKAFREKPKDPVGLAGLTRRGVRVDGQLRLHDEGADRGRHRRCGGRRLEARHRRRPDPALRRPSGRAEVYDFARNEVPGAHERERGYWRDVGTLDAFYEAHMDLISVDPIFNLYNRLWPILTWPDPLPPAKFVFEASGRIGHALDSMVCAGVVVSGATVRRSVLSPEVRVHSHSEVEGSILMHGVDVGRHAVVRNAIIDKNVRIAEHASVGVDPVRDRERFTDLGRRDRRDRQGRRRRGGLTVPTVVGLLRGVNVGGRTLPMAELRELVESLGFEDVRTYIQSGNVLFSAKKRPAPAVLEAAIERRFGLEVDVMLRSACRTGAGARAQPVSARGSLEAPRRLHGDEADGRRGRGARRRSVPARAVRGRGDGALPSSAGRHGAHEAARLRAAADQGADDDPELEHGHEARRAGTRELKACSCRVHDGAMATDPL